MEVKCISVHTFTAFGSRDKRVFQSRLYLTYISTYIKSIIVTYVINNVGFWSILSEYTLLSSFLVG